MSDQLLYHPFRCKQVTRGFSPFVTSMTAPIASGWSGCRVGLAPTGKRRLSTAHANSGHSATWRWSGLLLFKQTGLLFVRSTDSSSSRARSRDGHRRKLLSAIQQHRLVGLRDFCSGNELPQLAQARRADLQ